MRKNRGLVIVTPAARLLWWLKRFSPRAVDWVSREGWRSKGPVELEPDHVGDELGSGAREHGTAPPRAS